MATKKQTPKKAPKKVAKPKPEPVKLSAKKQAIIDELEGDFEGKIENILFLYNKGFTPKEIVAQGFNKSTVYRQTGELKKLQKAPLTSYYGYEVFEGKVQRIMKSKNLTHAKATEFLLGKIAELDEDSE